MKGTNRKIDNLGRIVIPISYRKSLRLEPNDTVTISMKNGEMTLTPLKRTCVVCGKMHEQLNNRRICKNCITIIKETENG